jgi:hypothetical protein
MVVYAPPTSLALLAEANMVNTKHYPMKNCCTTAIHLLFYGLFFLSGQFLQAQVNIIDPGLSVPPNINKCMGSTTLEATIQFTLDGTGPVPIRPVMMDGVKYVPGTVGLVSQSGGLSVTESNPDPFTPQFQLAVGDGTFNVGDEITISFELAANCDAMMGSNEVILEANYGGTIYDGEIAADVIEADLSMVVHPLRITTIGETEMVAITVSNGGLGSLDEVTFYIVESGMTTSDLTIDGNSIPVAFTNLDTSFYVIPATNLPGGTFDNTETIELIRTVT